LSPPERDPYTTVVAHHLTPHAARVLMRAIIEETPLVIYAKDLDHRFLLSNKQHGSLIGQPSSEILGQTDLELFGEEALEVEELTASVLSSGKSVAQEFQLTLQNEQRTFLETIFTLIGEDDEVIGLGGIATDITERRNLEVALNERADQLEEALHRLKTTQAQLVQQQKMAALGGLVAGLAHEVNTPLGAGIVAATYIEQRIEDVGRRFVEGRLTRRSMNESIEQCRQAAQLMVSNLNRAAHLLRSFQRVAVNQTRLTVQEGELDEWLGDVLLSLSPLMRQHHVFIQREVDTPAPVLFAAGELQQILTNLLMNAALHAFEPLSQEEAVRLAEDPELQRARSIWVRIWFAPKGLYLEVEDQGVGMTEEIAARVYDPFFTTRRARGGTGLGLSITYSLVAEKFGGTISMKTSPGEGARFKLFLPWCRDHLWRLPVKEAAEE
jgi:PAS domain S-box-containing protein